MDPVKAPGPTVMPVDMAKWSKEIHLSNFINAYYQVRDIRKHLPNGKILVVGPGQGLEVVVFRWLGFQVTTLDIDDRLKPDHVGSVHSMPMFKDQQFDAIVASHVLEHFAVDYLDAALVELSRVGKLVLVYLPVHGRHAQFRLKPGLRDWDWSLVINVFNYLEAPSGTQAQYSAGQHFWEVGMRGFRVKDLKRRFSKCFEVLSAYRNKDWLPSFNFVLKSTFGPQRSGSE